MILFNSGHSNEDGTILLSFVVDYKNGGGCPDTTYTKMDVDTKEAIEKITCEKFAQREKLKEDPCPKMTDDHIYAVYNYSQSYHPDKATDLSNKGKAW